MVARPEGGYVLRNVESNDLLRMKFFEAGRLICIVGDKKPEA